MPPIMNAEQIRKQTALLKRRRDIVKLYLEGHTHDQIGTKLGVSTATVGKDLATVREEWRQEYLHELTLQKADEIAKLKNLEVKSWEAYEKSKIAKRTSKQRSERVPTVNINEENGEEQIQDGDLRLVRQTEEEQAESNDGGDPRFLDRVAWCIEQRMKALGMFKPDGPQNVTNINLNWDEMAVKTGEQRKQVITVDAIEARISETLQQANLKDSRQQQPQLALPNTSIRTEDSLAKLSYSTREMPEHNIINETPEEE